MESFNFVPIIAFQFLKNNCFDFWKLKNDLYECVRIIPDISSFRFRSYLICRSGCSFRHVSVYISKHNYYLREWFRFCHWSRGMSHSWSTVTKVWSKVLLNPSILAYFKKIMLEQGTCKIYLFFSNSFLNNVVTWFICLVLFGSY